jgi:catechol 2,3-dioxygenase-like lactoylglutathione lyase family enzyme
MVDRLRPVQNGTVKVSGIHHVGVPVRDIQASLAWYREIFGIEPLFVVESEGPDVSAAVQLPDARITAALLPVGNTILELLQYHEPVGADFGLRNCDVGAIHIALQVEDIAEAHAALVARDADFSCPPTLIPEGDLAGYRFAYFRDPDGIQFELFQLPD